MRKDWKYIGLLISVSAFLLFFLACIFVGLYSFLDFVSTHATVLSVKKIVCIVGLVVSYFSVVIFDHIDRK